MKKYFNYAMMALCFAVSVTSCTKDDSEVENLGDLGNSFWKSNQTSLQYYSIKF